MGIMPEKGRRYFSGDIKGPDTKNQRDKKDKDGFIEGSLCTFFPQKADALKGDHRKVFNGKTITWFSNQLLANLKQPSLIILYNESYHLAYGEGFPKCGKLKRSDVVEYLVDKNKKLMNMSVLKLNFQMKKYIRRKVKYECVRLSEEKGHIVLYTPPYQSDLQPIEIIWELIKGNMGRKYSSGTTLDMVHTRLIKEFTEVSANGHVSIGKMIDKCSVTSDKMFITMDNDVLDDSDDDDDSSYCYNELYEHDSDDVISSEEYVV